MLCWGLSVMATKSCLRCVITQIGSLTSACPRRIGSSCDSYMRMHVRRTCVPAMWWCSRVSAGTHGLFKILGTRLSESCALGLLSSIIQTTCYVSTTETSRTGKQESRQPRLAPSLSISMSAFPLLGHLISTFTFSAGPDASHTGTHHTYYSSC